MSIIINFDLKELRELVHSKYTCVVEKKVTQSLVVQPRQLGNVKEAIINQLDYKIGKFNKESKGIILSYKNVRVLSNTGVIRYDGAAQFPVQTDFFIFQPFVGATLKGVVNYKAKDHLGILVHRVFYVVTVRPTEEPGNKWIGSGVLEGQEVMFRVIKLHLLEKLPYIEAVLDERSRLPRMPPVLFSPTTLATVQEVIITGVFRNQPDLRGQTGGSWQEEEEANEVNPDWHGQAL